MGTINKTIDYVNKFFTPQYFGYKKDDDDGDTVEITTSGTYQTYKPSTTNMTLFATSDFSYNPTTGVITYSGDGGYFDIDGCVSLGNISTPNSVVHFAICNNGTVIVEASAKTESATAIENLSLSSFLTPFPLETGDELTVDIKSTQASLSDVDIWHVQGKIKQVIPV